MKSSEEPVEVYRARTQMEAQVIKGLLESFNIPCVLKSNAAPSVHVLTIDGMSAVSVMVMASLADEARQLIRTEPPAEDEILENPPPSSFDTGGR